MVNRKPRQIVGHVVSTDKFSHTIQKMVDATPEAEKYCTDGYSSYPDVVFPEKHILNIHNKNDTFTVEGVNADLRHYIPTLTCRSKCFPRKLENLQAILALFIFAYNCFGSSAKTRYRSFYSAGNPPFFFLISFNNSFGHSRIPKSTGEYGLFLI